MRQRFDCTDAHCTRSFTTKQGRAVHMYRAHYVKSAPPQRSNATATPVRDQNNELDRQEFKQAFPEMICRQMGWTVLAVDENRHSMIVSIPLGE